jgi:hypothetical protein
MGLLSPFTGLASLPDGTVGTTCSVSLSEYVKGSGPITPVYFNVTLDDGSVL